MEFIKRNLFYLVLVVVLVLAGGGMGFLYFRWKDQLAEQLAARQKVAKELQNQLRGEKISPQLVQAEQAKVEAIRQAAEAVSQVCTQWNQHPVIMIPDIDAEGNTQTIPAFPFKGSVRGSIRFAYTQEYLKQLRALFAKLDATRPPTDAEIADQIEKAAQRIALQRRMEARKAGIVDNTAQLTQAAGGASSAQESIQAQAQREGRISAIVSRANGGAIYATIDALDSRILAATTTVTDTEMWQAQLNLWVQQDIIEAIIRTNKAVYSSTNSTESGPLVPDSAVKRLVRIDVTEDYYTGAESVGRGGTGGPSFREGGFEERGWRGEGRRGRQTEYREPSYDQDAGIGAQQVPTLTQRTTGPDYEVVQYEFEVMMPLRYLPVLEEQLQQLPYHTVLGHKYRAPTAAELQDYYFGTDPVMVVTIKGEMVLLSSWTRPLMPLEVLQSLQQQVPTAIRPEDEERLQAVSQASL